MPDLDQLAKRIEEQLAKVQTGIDARQKLADERSRPLQARLEKYNHLSQQLLEHVVRPRLEKLAGYFDNAKLERLDPAAGPQCSCRFQHTARFPASVQLVIGICHDEEVQHLILWYKLGILPIFMAFEPHDQKALLLDDVQDGDVAEWVDDKLVTFVQTYLKLQIVDQYQQENRVTDPVCGVRINAVTAAAKCEYHGRTYYFLSDENCREFKASPEQYVSTSEGQARPSSSERDLAVGTTGDS
jgi:YHS domain-containing protein